MTTQSLTTKMLTDYFRWLAAGAAAVVVVLGYFFWLAPKIADLRVSAVTERLRTQADLKSEQAYAAALAASIQKFRQALPEAQLQKIDDFLPSAADFPGLLLTVRNLGLAANLSLDSMTVGQLGQVSTAARAAAPAAASTTAAQAATVGAAGVRSQDVTVSYSGGATYEQFKNMLATIESSQRLFDVVNLSYTGATDATGGANWGLVLRTYYLPTGK